MAKTQLKGKQDKQIMNDKTEATIKSSHKKTTINLEAGKSAITMNPGKLYPIMYKEILAGEYIENWSIDNLTRIITPLVPTMDQVFLNVKAFFVPHTRVMKDWEDLFVDKGEAGRPVSEKSLPATIVNGANTHWQNFKYTLASRYGIPNKSSDTSINLLPIRGYRAITNDFIRIKEYEPKLIEFNETIPTQSEKERLNTFLNATYNGTTRRDTDGGDYVLTAAPTRRNYYTNIMKTNAVGDEYAKINANNTRAEHLDWQTSFQDAKQKAENANKNDWDIIAEMGGTSPVVNDRVEFLGEIDYELNYQQITQSNNELNAATPLGTTGSFSYTRANGTLFSHKQFRQHGFIHILASIIIDKAPEEATPKELLKIDIDEIYRPALAKKEIQLMYEKEISNTEQSVDQRTVAFQPPFAEYKRLPNLVSGEMRSKTLKGDPASLIPNGITNSQWHNFQEQNGKLVITGEYFRPTNEINKTLERNNALVSPEYIDEPYDDMIMNMSSHKVKTKLPMEEHDLKQVRKAEVSR